MIYLEHTSVLKTSPLATMDMIRHVYTNETGRENNVVQCMFCAWKLATP